MKLLVLMHSEELGKVVSFTKMFKHQEVNSVTRESPEEAEEMRLHSARQNTSQKQSPPAPPGSGDSGRRRALSRVIGTNHRSWHHGS